jgi:hypothetical protein
MLKGYTKELFDPNIVYEFGPLDRDYKRKMLSLGYDKPIVIRQDPLVARLSGDSKSIGLYVSTINTERTRGELIAGIDSRARGQDVLSDLGAGSEGQRFVDWITKQLIHNPGQSKLVPIFDQSSGEIINYRTLVSDNIKKEKFGRNDLATETLGRMFAQTRTKQSVEEINKEVVKGIFDIWQQNRESGVKFRYVGSDSKHEDAKAAFNRLPGEVRDLAKVYFGRNGMYVNDALYNHIMGFEEVSLTKFAKKTSKSINDLVKRRDARLPKSLLKAVNIADQGWRELVQQSRIKIGLATPVVIMGNFVSNVLMLTADGVPVTYIAAQSKKLMGDLLKLEKVQNEIGLLDAEILAQKELGNTVDTLESRKARLQQQLQSNALYPLQEAGLLAAPVTELLPGQLQAPNKQILNTVRKFTEFGREKIGKTAGFIGRTAEELYVAPGTKTFDLILRFNAVSDQLGRAIKYKYDTEKRGIDKDTALNDSLNYFVYYLEESSSGMTALNEYGVILFSKYFLRMQRAMARLIGEKAASTVSIYYLDQLMFEDSKLTGGATTPLVTYFGDAGKFIDKFDIPTIFKDQDALYKDTIWEKSLEMTVPKIGKDIYEMATEK